MKANTYFHLVHKFQMSGAMPPLHGVRMVNFTSLDRNRFFCYSAEHYLDFQTLSHKVNSAKPHIDFFGIVFPLCLLIDIFFLLSERTQRFEHYAFICFLQYFSAIIR
jgi:hypothetical protein